MADSNYKKYFIMRDFRKFEICNLRIEIAKDFYSIIKASKKDIK